jgi:hypothetical protein
MLHVTGKMVLLKCTILAVILAIAAAHLPSAVAGTPAFNKTVLASQTLSNGCSDVQNKAVRNLASAKESRAQHLCHLGQLSLNKIRYHTSKKNRWVLLLNHDKCQEAPTDRWAAMCYKSRQEVRQHLERLNWVNKEVSSLIVRTWLYNAFLCVHHYEGAWNANTGNGYYGGLQMDLNFQTSYGKDFLHQWATADNWPIWAQVTAAIRAYASGRGFGPWPNTARACGYSTVSVVPATPGLLTPRNL